MKEREGSPNWGFISPDGHFQLITSLTTVELVYASKTLKELEILLREQIQKEAYEECAVIKKEMDKRLQ